MDLNPNPESLSAPTLVLSGKPYLFQGYVYGFHQPTVRYQVTLGSVNLSGLSEIDIFASKVLGLSGNFDAPVEHPILTRIKYWPSAILHQANHPIFEPARLLRPDGKNSNYHIIIQPCLDHRSALLVVDFIVDLLKLASLETVPTESFDELKRSFEGLVKNLEITGLNGFNQMHFLLAASELGISWYRLHGIVFQLGIGRNARWIESSFTDATSVISSNAARQKPVTAHILTISGLPVPKHFLVRNKDEAIRHAELLGYPVVIKPADFDGGQGVKANLQRAEAVGRAFLEAEKVSKRVMVEKHVPGRDYRIHVVNGEVHGVLERVPGGVTGNGADCVRILLERQNKEREIAVDERRYLHQMAFDEEADELLASQNLDWQSIPANGQFVRLRGACNVASGGIPIPVPLDKVHPDNLYLARRAARGLRLDVAGIDLLIPDIERSWLSTGAYICEVNAQPQMFSSLHKPMLISMFKGRNGRIPVAIIIEAACVPENIGFSILRECRARGINAALVSGNEMWIGEYCVNKACSGAFDGARMLSFDNSVEALVIHVTDNQIMYKGWPVDFCDILAVGTRQAANKKTAYSPVDWLSFAATLNPRSLLIEDYDPGAHKFALSLFNNQNIVNTANWSGQEQRGRTVMRVVNELVSRL